jgi:hypothetical protein
MIKPKLMPDAGTQVVVVVDKATTAVKAARVGAMREGDTAVMVVAVMAVVAVNLF